MSDKPDFAALRAQRDAAIKDMVKTVYVKMGGDPNETPSFHCRDFGGCYCNCPEGPCEHEFSGWRELHDDEGNVCGGEQSCKLCGMGAMSHSISRAP